jgi:hypothetical protein
MVLPAPVGATPSVLPREAERSEAALDEEASGGDGGASAAPHCAQAGRPGPAEPCPAARGGAGAAGRDCAWVAVTGAGRVAVPMTCA